MKPAKNKNEKIKLALIPLLVLVLVAVLPGSDSDDDRDSVSTTDVKPAAAQTTTTVVVARKPATAGLNTPSTTLKASATERLVATWPRAPLRTVLQHDPFVFSDPRALLDRAFFAAGMTAPVQMEEVSLEEFLPPAPIVDAASAENDLLADLLQFFPDPNSTSAPPVDKQPTQAITDHGIESNQTAPLADALSREEVLAQERVAAMRQARLLKKEQLQQKLAALKTQPITMFMQSPTGNSVLLGDRRISSGELVEEGIIVRAIDREGITFEIIEPVASAQEPSLQ